MSSLDLKALADALEQWGQPIVSGHASAGLVECLVTGKVVDYCLVIAPALTYITDALVCV